MLADKLEELGLTEKEAKVYLAILELGEANIVRIVKKSDIKRTTVYEMLELLKEKRLVSATKKKNRTYYLAEDPRKLEQQFDEKKRVLREVAPELLSLMNLIDKKPKIRYFEGREGLKEVFRDTLNYPNQEMLTWFPYPYINLRDDFFEKFYHPERVAKKITARAIIPDNPTNREFGKSLEASIITRTRFVTNPFFGQLELEIKIYGKRKVGIVSYAEDMGLIIESEKIYTGLKGIFEALWEKLPE